MAMGRGARVLRAFALLGLAGLLIWGWMVFSFPPGGGGAYQDAPKVATAGQPLELKLRLVVWGGGGPAKDRYDQVQAAIRWPGSGTAGNAWVPVPASPAVPGVPANAKGTEVFYRFQTLVPEAAAGQALEFRYTFRLDGHASEVAGQHPIQVVRP
jgi:hypothetical protein